ncbi:putative fad dependent oxidoreductase superfamily protein [Phaeomoniella chlamydospora]|uniref:Putative fad dependent oxidoreductase superfamily protein n=1 Tax=Phaeomoniella chlamydospora TaxID=158046 RepID=A0A0G2F0X2_PHACM|nr:putative fad dependent oxidoreductase superfamily protein [Phaeomoniella chlamydospora]
MGGGECLPGFPHPYPTNSYWQLPPHAIANHRTTPQLDTSQIFDYIIVGSGVSGAAVAYKLLSRDPNLSILMLEARTAASGASGRNGGHCRAGRWLHFKQYYDAFGEDEALKLESLEEENVQDIADFVREHDVECDFEDVETADVYLTEEAWAEALEMRRLRERVHQRRSNIKARMKLKVRHGAEASEYIGIPNLVGSVTYPAHTQNPYLLVCRMLELSLEKGLNLQTTTPATGIVKSGAIWSVETERGTVRANQVILATNGYTNALHSGLAATKFLVPARNQVAAIRPGKNIGGNPVLRRSINVDDLATGDYFMSRAPGLKGEGDVLYGGGKSLSRTGERNTTDDSVVHADIAEYLKHAAVGVFGREKWGEEGPPVRDWTGIVAYTPDTFPLVGEAPGESGLWMSVGMNGHGMAMAFRCAEALVEMMAKGAEPEWFPKAFRLERVFTKKTVHFPGWMES